MLPKNILSVLNVLHILQLKMGNYQKDNYIMPKLQIAKK